MEIINKIFKFISTPIGITILVVVLLILIVLLLILIFKKAKQNNIETNDKPNLMISDPVQDGDINLMAPDPLAPTIKTEFPIIEEELSLEKHLSIEEEIITIEPNQQETNKEIPNAFEMTPKEKPKTIKEVKNHFHKTQKFCPDCGTPNDVLNKFCISCGYNFEK